MLKPIYDNVILKIEEEGDTVDCGSGLVMKKAAGQKTRDTGIVASCGEGRITMSGEIIPMRVSAGDRVIFNKFAGTEISSNGELYLIVKESDILAILS